MRRPPPRSRRWAAARVVAHQRRCALQSKAQPKSESPKPAQRRAAPFCVARFCLRRRLTFVVRLGCGGSASRRARSTSFRVSASLKVVKCRSASLGMASLRIDRSAPRALAERRRTSPPISVASLCSSSPNANQRRAPSLNDFRHRRRSAWLSVVSLNYAALRREAWPAERR